MMIFLERVKELAENFKALNSPIRVISHLDADGISAGAIISRALEREEKKFSLTIIRQLTNEKLLELSKEKYENFLFLDLGSGHIPLMESLLKGKKVFILDHHIPEKDSKIINIANPHLAGLTSDDVSGAGVSYLFSKFLNSRNKDLAHLAIIGALGDTQEVNISLNKEILNDALETGNIKIEKGLRMFGLQTRPIHKLLEYSLDPFIPEITGNEEKAIHFLNSLKIPVKDEKDNWRKVCDLGEEELKKLAAAIILKRMPSQENPEDIFGEIYVLPSRNSESPTRNAKEFATLLNACGKLGKPSIGLAVCLSEKFEGAALELLNQYRKEIVDAINWFYQNKNSEHILENEKFILIKTNGFIRETLTGVMASVLSRSNIIDNQKLVIVSSHTSDGKIKFSIRTNKDNLNLKELLGNLKQNVEIDYGGHKNAAGCFVEKDQEEKFVKCLLEEINRKFY